MQSAAAVRIKCTAAVLLLLAAFTLVAGALVRIHRIPAVREKVTAGFTRTEESLEEEFEDETICPVAYISEDGRYLCTVSYRFADWEALPEDHEFTGTVYLLEDGRYAAFDHEADEAEIRRAVQDLNADAEKNIFGIALAFALMAVCLFVMYFWGHFFTDYEQIWFLSIMILAGVISILVPEEDVNGIQGVIVMAMYLADTFLNILCELLISKQSKWNFIVSVFVEITEIVICIVLMYRFATMATTLFFWLPCDILSFINWHRHPDKQEEELTVVRTLKGWQEALIIAGIVVWTVVVGYFLSHLDFLSDFIQNRTLEVVIAYLDACASAVGVVNGVFILLRLREQWIAWYICAALESAINVLSGQFVLLVLKLGYFTNTTYGYIKWTKYIKSVQKKEIED